MKIRLTSRPPAIAGYTLIVVLIFTSLGLLVLAGALDWSATNTKLNARNNEYFNTVAAAEAATEKVLAHMANDFQSQGESLVYANLGSYRLLSPTSAENSKWADYEFSNVSGAAAQSYVERTAAASYTPLQSQYSGIYGLASSYQVQSYVRNSATTPAIEVGVKQDVQLATIPVFQFAIFYSMDLEINPGPNMTINGRVHGNQNIYMQPVSTLTFQNHVTASGKLFTDKHPDDPLSRNTSNSKIVFEPGVIHEGGKSSITLPIGTNNTADAVAAILDIPPSDESATSLMGKQRFYNKADLIVVVSNSSVSVKSGQFNNFSTIVASNDYKKFLNTSASYYNKREGKTVNGVDIDVGALKAWSETNATLRTALGGRDVRSIYVADMRPQTVATEAGVRVKNGQTLPSLGLTVSTPNPLYVQGHYNVPNSALGTHDTSGSKPAALIGDAINVLSTAWEDSESALLMNSLLGIRQASSTTINAAFLAGNVPTTNGYYSGGVENFPRFLENWADDDIFTYNGSMVMMFHSRQATAPWGGADVYDPPPRDWAFDVNFMDPTKLPPGTPEVRALLRAQYAVLGPRTKP